MRVAGLVLAAGGGQRFGRPKAVVEIDGRRFVDRAVAALADGGCEPVFVVVGATEVGHVDAIVVRNEQWQEGIGSSLVAGLDAVRRYADQVHECDEVIVVLADQPMISPTAVARIVTAAADGAVAALAVYHGISGHPVLLNRSTWREVAERAVGDQGAKPYFDAHPTLITYVNCDGLGSPADVDTVEDLARLTAGH